MGRRSVVEPSFLDCGSSAVADVELGGHESFLAVADYGMPLVDAEFAGPGCRLPVVDAGSAGHD